MIEFFQQFHNQVMDADRFPVAVMALLLTAIVGMVTGPMHGNANPFYWKVINAIFGRIGARLDRLQRKTSDLAFRGLLLCTAALMFSYVAGQTAGDLAVSLPFHGITEIILLSLLLTSGTVWYSLLKLYFALKDNKIVKGAYYGIAFSTRTDLSVSDNFTITRVGMGFAARAFDKGAVAPVIWYLLAGLPGAFLYSCLAALAWRFGKDGFTKGFGAVPLALEKLAGFIPMILAGVLIALAGLFTPTGGMTRALLSLLRGEGRAKYEQGALPVTAMAYALGVSLGGPVTDLEGSALKRDWISPEGATAKLESGHLRRAIYITLMAYLLFIVSLMASILYSGWFF